MIPVIYEGLCNVCNKDLFWEEIEKGKCKISGKQLCYSEIEPTVKEFEGLFKKLVGSPRKIQKFWMRRIVKRESFTAVAPTGIGKTTFGVVSSLFFLLKGGKSYIIVPTTLLVQQVVDEIVKFSKKLGKKIGVNEPGEWTILYYHGNMKKKEKFKELAVKGEYHILVTTTQFLSRNFPLIQKTVFDFIFVDDVDAVLKASRNVDKILLLLGFKKNKNRWEGLSKGVLIVSTATSKKGRAANLFRKLLNFDIGTSSHAARNIEDVIVSEKEIDSLKEILRKMGTGGVIYATNAEEAERYYNALKKEFKIGMVTAKDKKDYKLFEKGELDYLIGIAYYYGILVRGLDLPERIRFVVFLGAPVLRIKYEEITPRIARILVLAFRNHPEIKKYLPVINRLESDENLVEEIRERFGKIDVREIDVDIVLRRDEIIIPDIKTYIQGSGRASRLTAHGLTKGASFILERDEEILKAFVKRASYYEIFFKPVEEVDFQQLIKEIDNTRKERKDGEDIIKPVLFIVESPTKARTISRFFGKPSVKLGNLVVYEVPTPNYILLVTASLGHVVDLTSNRGFFGVEDGSVPVYGSIKRCRDCGYQFTEERNECPKCGSENIDDSKKRIDALREIAKDVELILVGTDPDTEGEKIAWDLKNLLTGCGEVKRVEFHEITKRAINETLENQKEINENRVKAQMVRRIEDRWLGFTLSQIVQKRFKNKNLSAGRAQTPVLGWIIERYEESRRKKKIGISRELGLIFEDIDSSEIKVEIKKLDKKVEEKDPLPPYTTDTLLRDANNILKFSTKETMNIAQTLFENGLITYHRTDSPRVSDAGLFIAKEILGKEFHTRRWKTEGAHECIRPTKPYSREMLQRLIEENVIVAENISQKHLAVYDLIFRRFVASQCPPYKTISVKYSVKYCKKEIVEERTIYAEGKALEYYKWSVWVKPELPEGERTVSLEVRVVPGAKLFTQSDLIQTMKERSIGRPSTYAILLEKLFLRNYIIERKGSLIPTKQGMYIYRFLKNNFEQMVSEERTKLLEEKMDMIEEGKKDYLEALRELYEEILKNASKVVQQ